MNTQSLRQLGALAAPSRPGSLGRIDKYDLLRELGCGGMGVVYLATNSETQELVAIKMVKPELRGNDRFVRQFVRECWILRDLHADNPELAIVPVYDINETGGVPYCVMKYMKGGTLASLLKPEREFSPTDLIAMVTPIAEAMEYAYRTKSFVHRDIKPANILLSGDGAPLLGDFGLMRTVLTDDSSVSANDCNFAGTPAYMSPEVAGDQAGDTRSDIYSLGAVMYQMVAARPPYTGHTAMEIIGKVLSGPPEPLRAIKPDVPPELERIIEKAMARDLANRYASMTHVLDDLRKYYRKLGMGGEPAVVRPASRRPWLLVSFSISLGVLVSAFAAWWTLPGQPVVSPVPPRPQKPHANVGDTRMTPPTPDEVAQKQTAEHEEARRAWNAGLATANQDLLKLFVPRDLDALKAKADEAQDLNTTFVAATALYKEATRALEEAKTKVAEAQPIPWLKAKLIWEAALYRADDKVLNRYVPRDFEAAKVMGAQAKGEADTSEFERAAVRYTEATLALNNAMKSVREVADRQRKSLQDAVTAWDATWLRAGKGIQNTYVAELIAGNLDAAKAKADAAKMKVNEDSPVTAAALYNDATLELTKAIDAAMMKDKARKEVLLAAKKAWALVNSGADVKMLGRYAPDLLDAANANVVSARREEEAGAFEAATNFYKDAAAVLNVAMSSASTLQKEFTIKEERGQAFERLKMAIAKQEKIEADEILAELTHLMPGDERLRPFPAIIEALPGPPKERAVPLGGGVSIEFVRIRPGSFMARRNTKDAHLVTFKQPFYLGKYEVTQEQWMKLMKSNPSKFKGPENVLRRNPVDSVPCSPDSHGLTAGCQEFIALLNAREGANLYRLPTEDEWEYACRAGKKTEFCCGDDAAKLGDFSWYQENSGKTTHPVGQKEPNAWGLYDMHGNVREWCADWWADPPGGVNTNALRVLRGGSYKDPAGDCGSAARGHLNSGLPNDGIGFRLLRIIPPPPPSPAK